jgi:hydroxyacylglutathione hydrolase
MDEVQIVDVRMRSEWDAGHLPNAIHFEGGRIAWEELPFPQDKPLAIQCASGNRSMSAISVLKRRGYRNVIQVEGGINKWRMHQFEVVQDDPELGK